MLELIKELKSKEDSFRSYVQVEVFNLLSKIIDSNEIKKNTKNRLSLIMTEMNTVPFDSRNPHLGNQTSHNLINSYIKMSLFILKNDK